MTERDTLAALLRDAFRALNARQESGEFPVLVADRLIAAGVRVAPSPTEPNWDPEATGVCLCGGQCHHNGRTCSQSCREANERTGGAPSPTEGEATEYERGFMAGVEARSALGNAPSPDAPGGEVVFEGEGEELTFDPDGGWSAGPRTFVDLNGTVQSAPSPDAPGRWRRQGWHDAPCWRAWIDNPEGGCTCGR